MPMFLPTLFMALWASILCAALAGCAQSAPDVPSTDSAGFVAPGVQATEPGDAEPGSDPAPDPGARPDDDVIELPPDGYHSTWRVVATDDPHAQALMKITIQSSAGESEGSGDWVLFQPFCDAVADQPISGSADCELIDMAAAFDRVQATPEQIALAFHPTADEVEHRLELRRDGERLRGYYVIDDDAVRRAIVAERIPQD